MNLQHEKHLNRREDVVDTKDESVQVVGGSKVGAIVVAMVEKGTRRVVTFCVTASRRHPSKKVGLIFTPQSFEKLS
jgi:hypothetical protein